MCDYEYPFVQRRYCTFPLTPPRSILGITTHPCILCGTTSRGCTFLSKLKHTSLDLINISKPIRKATCYSEYIEKYECMYKHFNDNMYLCTFPKDQSVFGHLFDGTLVCMGLPEMSRPPFYRCPCNTADKSNCRLYVLDLLYISTNTIRL